MRASEALILACIRAHYNPNDSPADFAGYVNDGISWPKVLSAARRHGIVPLVYEASSRSSKVPTGAQRALGHEFGQSAANSFFYAGELVRLSKYFDEQGIAALAFKGPALALLLYGNLSLRTVRDLDLLVAKDQTDLALNALRDCGYTPVSGVGGAPPYVSANIRKHILLVHQVLGFSVELHWALTEPSFVFPLRFDEVWAERQMVTVMNQPIATLGREHMLLMMCAHGTNHCWGSLKWICDIAQAVVSFSDLDWNRLMTRAQALGGYRMLLVGLALAKEICGVELPKELQPHVRCEKVDRIRRAVQARLFSESEPAVNLERTLLFVRSRERFLDRIGILLRFAGPELKPRASDLALFRFPNYLRILYFPLRAFRILLFRWSKTVQPMLRGALDRFAPSPPE